MPRYLNAYQMLSDLREGINEYSSALLNGTDTTGAFSNDTLMRYLNEAQLFLFHLTFVKRPEEYLKNTILTPVDSRITLPSDFFKVARLEYLSDGVKIHRLNQLDYKRGSGSSGSKYLYRREGRDTLVIDHAGVTDQVYLWYYWKPRLIHAGQAQSGSGVNALKMSTKAVARMDYYKGMMVEDVTAGFVSSISAFNETTLVATVSGTASNGDNYGLIPEAPEEFHHLIVKKAVILAKSDVKSPMQATPKEIAEFNEMLSMTLQSYYGIEPEDVPVENIFLELGG